LDKKKFNVSVILASRAFDSSVLTDNEICELIEEAIREKFAVIKVTNLPIFVESNCTISKDERFNF
tara:strand:+ start:31983 stop:32180 length:198 start_codon:yes stop_codon:yes gene_type:complete